MPSFDDIMKFLVDSGIPKEQLAGLKKLDDNRSMRAPAKVHGPVSVEAASEIKLPDLSRSMRAPAKVHGPVSVEAAPEIKLPELSRKNE